MSNEGNTETPISSLFSLGVLYLGTVEEPYSKQSSVKCFEHTADERVGVHLSLLRRMKFTHIFFRFAATVELSFQKGI